MKDLRVTNKTVEFNDSQLDAFGDIVTSQDIPVIQATGAYEFIPANFRSYTSISGSTIATSKMLVASCGTTAFGYGAIQSFRSINYKAGQGALVRFSGLFSGSASSHWSGIGLVNVSDEFSFGYDGNTFGIWHRYNGVSECRTITVTASSSGSTNLTLTLNTVAYVIPLTPGTIAHNCYEIATWLNANQSIWTADQVGNTVIIISQSDGAKSGTYTYSHATSTASITQNKAGATKSSTHIPQSQWNGYKVSNLLPTLGNNYAIQFKYGFGNVRFFIENKQTSKYMLVHTIKFANTNTAASVSQPSMLVGWYSASVGSTTDISVRVSECSGFIQGVSKNIRNPRSVSFTQSVTTVLTNVLTIRNRKTYNFIHNQVELEPIHLSIASESAKNVEIQIRTNPTFSGDTNYSTTGTNLISDVDYTPNTVTGGTAITGFTLSSNQSSDVDLKTFEIRLPPSLYVSVSARITSGAASNVTAILTYLEDL